MEVGEERARWEKNLRFGLQKVDAETDRRLDFTININGKRFIITIYSTSHPEDQVAPLISQFSKALLEDDFDNCQAAQDELEDIIYEAGWRKFGSLAPGIETEHLNDPVSLYTITNPETFFFRLTTEGGNLDVIQEHPSLSNQARPYVAIDIVADLPRYSVHEILFIEKLIGHGFIAKVSVNGQEMCCKMLAPAQLKAVQREYECLKKIADSKYASLIQAPRLVGLVVESNDDQGVIGILEEYIPHTMSLGGPREGIHTIASERKEKWAEQVKRNIQLLHEIDVVWGDGKPQNVLIHKETDECCLVDFGGSWTDGWVDRELRESKAGDEQTLSRILDFLGV